MESENFRLTNQSRSDVCEKALLHKFAKRKAELDKEESSLAMLCYRKVLGDTHIREVVSKLKAGWFAENSNITYNFGDMGKRKLKSNKPLKVWRNYYTHETFGAITDDTLRNHCNDLFNAKDAYEEARNNASIDVMQLLNSVSTYRQLCELWPEGKDFYKFLSPPVKLPAPRVSAINEMLGLP